MKRKKTISLAACLFCAIAYVAFVVSAGDEDGLLKKYARMLPEFTLQDPLGNAYTASELVRNGLVLVVTSPILRDEMDQRGWDEQLRQAKEGAPGRLVFLQDMRQSYFKRYALSKMRKDYRAGDEPILLIDDDGSVRERLKVEPKCTVVLVYDAGRRLVYAEEGHPAAKAAKSIWAALKK
jgi:hypothetical protein